MITSAERNSPARDLAYIAVFAAFIAALGVPGSLSLFGNAVPITLQTFGVMLAGSLLGARRAGLSVVLFLVLVAAGLPLLAGGRGGLAVFAGPSAGYIVGFLVGAVAIGFLTERWGHGFFRVVLANLLGGVVLMYALGVPVQAAVTGTSLTAAAVSSLVFLPGDLIKVALAASIAQAVYKAVPDLAPTSRRDRQKV